MPIKRKAPKKAAPKKKTKAVAAKAAPKKKKPIGFEMMKSYQNQIEKSYERLQLIFDQCGEDLNDYVYGGKKKMASITRTHLMDITKEAKTLRSIIQEAKMKLKPKYKAKTAQYPSPPPPIQSSKWMSLILALSDNSLGRAFCTCYNLDDHDIKY